MPDSDAIVGHATWKACEMCKWGQGKYSCQVTDFKYENLFDSFICEDYEYKPEDDDV